MRAISGRVDRCEDLGRIGCTRLDLLLVDAGHPSRREIDSRCLDEGKRQQRPFDGRNAAAAVDVGNAQVQLAQSLAERLAGKADLFGTE